MLLVITCPGGHDGWDGEGGTEFERCLVILLRVGWDLGWRQGSRL